ncbi:hypothetical protein G6F48_012590 [Rhizopus delemar]|nr:hypothetical protein G6F48_012590 [Rhizopus delemar]
MVLTKRQNATRRISSSTINADSVATSSRANNNMATTVSEEKVGGSHHNDMMMDIDDDATEDLSNEDNNRDSVISSGHLDSRTTTIMAPFGEQENNKNTNTNSVWANATTTRSFSKVISEKEMELKLKQDIQCLKQEVYNAVQMAVVTSVDDPNFDDIWAREVKLKDKLNKANCGIYACNKVIM